MTLHTYTSKLDMRIEISSILVFKVGDALLQWLWYILSQHNNLTITYLKE